MKCIVCGNDIKDNLDECPICGSKQVGAPIYNTQQFSNLQHQINNMHINNNQSTNDNINNNYTNSRPMQPQPMQSNNYYQQPNNYNQVVVNPTKGKDIFTLIISSFGIYYSLCVVSVIKSGLREFVDKTLSDPKYAEIITNNTTVAFCVTWPLFLFSIIGIIVSLISRKTNKNKLNAFSLIASVCVLAVGVVSTVYICNNL